MFRLGDDEFGLPIEAVDEVARVPDQITRLPRTPKFLEGVVNLRGEVLPVVDQRRRFDMPALDDASRSAAWSWSGPSATRRASSSIRCPRCCAARPTRSNRRPTSATRPCKLVHGVINLEQAGRIVLLLDPAELLTRAERGLLDAFRAKAERAVL